MKDLLRNRKFRFILIPALAAIWPVWTGSLSLPEAKANWMKEKSQYLNAQKLFLQILDLDPDRLKLAEDRANAGNFDYSTEVEKTANMIGIPAANYKLTVRQTIKVSGREVQSANLTLENVDITRFTQFLATIQLVWPNLQCTQLKLTKQKGLPDSWKVNLQFKYYK